MHISDKLANLNWERNHGKLLSLVTTPDQLFIFDGDVYTGLDVYYT
jgi:cytoplasmic iron level regulating protein YaaA (DUF328/UPF0246 family)